MRTSIAVKAIPVHATDIEVGDTFSMSVRLVLEFESKDSLIEWFGDAQDNGSIPDGKYTIYGIDMLDPHPDYIVRKTGERPGGMALYP